MINIIFNIVTGLFLSKITVLLIDAIAIYLALIVYRDNKKGKLNKIYAAMTFLMLCWVNFAYSLHLTGYNYFNLGLVLLKISWFVTPLFFVFLYFLSIVLTDQEKKYKRLTNILFLVGLLTAIITGFTNKVISGVSFPEQYSADILYGSWMYPFLTVIALIILATLIPVFKKNILKDNRVRYFLTGVFIFYFANVIFNIILPIFFGVSSFYFFGDYSTLILLGYTSYSILRHKLFDIKVVATEVLIFVVWLILATKIFTATDVNNQISGIVVLVLTIIFGVLLVRSVKKEIFQREQIEIIATDLKRVNIRLKKLDQEKSDFLSFATHQLRAPLSGIKGYAAMVLGGSFGKINKQLRVSTKLLSESNERLLLLIDNLLDSSRIELGRMKFSWGEVKPVELIKSVMQELKSKADAKKIKLIFKTPATRIPIITIDEEKIRQVVINLIDNAIKYTLVGKVEVSLSADKNNLTLTIADTGIGIKKEDIPHLFKKYSRVEAGHIKGTGLGLYVAKMMAEAHHGKITAESKGEGKGSKMVVVLPIKK